MISGEDDGTTWNPDAFDLIIDGTDFGSIQGTDQCNGQPVDITGDFTTWTSGNSAVATVATKQVHAVGAGSTNAYAYGEVEAGNGGYCTLVPAQAVAPVTVCPSYTTVSALTPLSIVLLFPQLKTGIGAVAAMQVNPTSSVWNVDITETVKQISNGCPATWGNICFGNSTFPVGQGYQAQVLVNGVPTLVGAGLSRAQNIFYDQHTVTDKDSDFDISGINSCTAVCSQTYYCQGIPISSDTITYMFIKAR